MTHSIPPDAYVMIIGAMKAGTSSLFHLLAQHPAICASRAKEPEYFSQHQENAVPVERYQDLYDFDSHSHRLCLEASTGYAKYPEETGVPDRIWSYGLRPRFIYIVRDPIARIHSHINYAHVNNHAWASDSLFGFHAVTFSMYNAQLQEYLKCFPDRRLFFIADFDDLKNDPHRLADDIFRWLGLDSMAVEVAPPANVTPPRSKAELALVRSPVHALRHLLPRRFRDQAKNMLRAISTSAERGLTGDQEEHLRTWLQPDVLAFGEAFDFPVEKWGFVREPHQAGAE